MELESPLYIPTSAAAELLKKPLLKEGMRGVGMFEGKDEKSERGFADLLQG